MGDRLSDEGRALLFTDARTHSYWLDRPISDETLRELYELMKWAPTSVNGNPVRIVFLRTPDAKQRLLPALASGNVEKTMSAPVTAIIGFDLRFYEHLPELMPNNPAYRDMFARAPELTEITARRNSSLQGAYFIFAARAVGLDCGPMSGFDSAKVDHEFFGGGIELAPNAEEFFTVGCVKTNFLCNLGYGDPSKLRPRSPRFEFDEVCKLL